MDAVEGEDDVDEDVAGSAVEGDGFDFLDGAGTEAVDDAGGVGTGDGGSGFRGEVEFAVAGVEDCARLPGGGVNAET